MAIPDELRRQLGELLKEAQDGDHLVKIVDTCLDLLKKHGFAQSMRVPPTLVGVHPLNRDGYGLNAHDVKDLLEAISDVGFVASMVSAIAVEVSCDEERRWNERLVASAGGQLGHMDGNQLRALSLAGSHTNFVLRSFVQELPSTNQHVAVDGKLNVQKLRDRDTSFADHCQHGLQWLVLSHHVAREFPALLEMVQQRGNATLARPEHELQVMRRIHNLVTRSAQSDHVEYDMVKKRVLATKPQCALSVPYMFSFAVKQCGGRDAHLLKDSEAFIRANSPSSRTVGPQVWQLLAQDSKSAKGSQQFPHFRHAVLKAAYVQANVGVQDVKKMLSRDMHAKVLEANDLLVELRGLAKSQCPAMIGDHGLENAIGLTDMAVTNHVLHLKLGPSSKKYKSLGGIAHDFALVLRHLSGKDIPSKWQQHEELQPNEDASRSSTSKAPTKLSNAKQC